MYKKLNLSTKQSADPVRATGDKGPIHYGIGSKLKRKLNTGEVAPITLLGKTE